jgi:hypothetical protein
MPIDSRYAAKTCDSSRPLGPEPCTIAAAGNGPGPAGSVSVPASCPTRTSFCCSGTRSKRMLFPERVQVRPAALTASVPSPLVSPSRGPMVVRAPLSPCVAPLGSSTSQVGSPCAFTTATASPAALR